MLLGPHLCCPWSLKQELEDVDGPQKPSASDAGATLESPHCLRGSPQVSWGSEMCELCPTKAMKPLPWVPAPNFPS